MNQLPLEPHAPVDERESKSKAQVLIVDDSPQYARLFELIADELGIAVHCVDNCKAAIDELERQTYDIVLMDWLMPEVDGPKCARMIRQAERSTGNHITIIGISGYLKATRQGCIDAGMDDYLPIPFTYEELHEKLSSWLAKVAV